MWFRPWRLGKWIAVYRPTSWQGWLVTIVLLTIAVFVFHRSDTLLAFAPWAIVIMCLFDLACFRKGEYPWWWRKHDN